MFEVLDSTTTVLVFELADGVVLAIDDSNNVELEARLASESELRTVVLLIKKVAVLVSRTLVD